MSPVKRFFLIYFAVYLAVGITLVVLFGPPGYSSAYLAKYEDQNERYLEVIDSPEYKLYEERPHLNPPSPALEQELAFVEQYEANPDFQAEKARRARFHAFTSYFNFLMVAYLIVHFARKPLGGFLAERVEHTRKRIADAENARREAETLKRDTQAKLAGLDTEKAELADRTKMLIDEETVRAEEFTKTALAELDLETEQRKQAEELEARRLVRAELVRQAVAQLAERYTREASPERVARLTEEFARELENRA